MKVHVELKPACGEPRVVIYTEQISPEIQELIRLLEGPQQRHILVQQGRRTIFIHIEDIEYAHIEGGELRIFTSDGSFVCPLRLYELARQLGPEFIQVSKYAIVRLSSVMSVEAAYNSTLCLHLKSGATEYVSRNYLKAFKACFGL